MSEKDVELGSLKVKCDELEEKEETLRKDLDDATKGSAILDREILGNYLLLFSPIHFFQNIYVF